MIKSIKEFFIPDYWEPDLNRDYTVDDFINILRKEKVELSKSTALLTAIVHNLNDRIKVLENEK